MFENIGNVAKFLTIINIISSSNSGIMDIY